ncbi:hypothetical protein NVP1115B_49 [Vibrio phage 1.115.B._10N.222.49.B11]|nr:hypothetical protein NVP1115A_49 [Vibrio phage 1.115.A._10N.222.49.B11]AUR88595.1 hypothetical protein NVP1115B_49 [Vibrio phage 1.115.B._10N.222.49.B11]
MMDIPNKAHKDDVGWITEKLKPLLPQMRSRAVYGYDEVFTAAYDSEPTEHRKSNKGRKAANTRLRLFVDKFYKASIGHTIKPPITK